jgi:hypothetical protein
MAKKRSLSPDLSNVNSADYFTYLRGKFIRFKREQMGFERPTLARRISANYLPTFTPEYLHFYLRRVEERGQVLRPELIRPLSEELKFPPHLLIDTERLVKEGKWQQYLNIDDAKKRSL